jgi:hypothetical protein
MDWSIPFSCKFIEIRCIPEVLVKLPVCKTTELCPPIKTELKHDEEQDVIHSHYGLVPTWEKFRCRQCITAKVLKMKAN